MDGNIFFILGKASSLLKQNGMNQESQEMWNRVQSSHSYDEALCIISEYVETELSPTVEMKKGKRDRDER